MAKKIVLTGGGTAGHVTPNIALLPSLREAGYEIYYIGSYDGIEARLIKEQKIPYYGIASGKLRRYFDWKNFTDPFRVIHGYSQARRILSQIKPDVLFSKGGFVSVPVVRAASRLHIRTIIHESDMTPGLANRLAIPAADKVCCSFPETLQYLPEGKAVLSGSPIRRELLTGSREKALQLLHWEDSSLPTLLVIGGSQGSVAINNALRSALDTLLKEFRIIHLCGKGHLDDSLNGREGYGKPNLLIPLSAAASRGDQILNAESYEKQGYSMVLKEEDLTTESLIRSLQQLGSSRDTYIAAMEKSSQSSAIDIIMGLITGQN